MYYAQLGWKMTNAGWGDWRAYMKSRINIKGKWLGSSKPLPNSHHNSHHNKQRAAQRHLQ